jgi:hypothetical protein
MLMILGKIALLLWDLFDILMTIKMGGLAMAL